MPDAQHAAVMHDAHNHLQDPLLNECRMAYLANRPILGLGYQVVNGTAESDWSAVRALADADPQIIPAFGIHPWHVDTISETWQNHLTSYLEAGGCIGEIGLDRWKTSANFELQRSVFEWQWHQGIQRRLATTVHCLRAWGPLMEIIREAPHHDPGFLLHAYSGPVEMLNAWVELGAYFSFSASFLATGREKKLEPFRMIPPDRLLVETDAPSMPPPASLLTHSPMHAPDGSEIHDPSDISVAYEGLARLRNQPMWSLRSQVNVNFHRLFLRSPIHGVDPTLGDFKLDTHSH